jgi:hypothetical protein
VVDVGKLCGNQPKFSSWFSQMEVALLSKCVLNLQRCNFKFRKFGRDTNLPLAIFLVEFILKVKIVYQDMNI